MSWKEKMGNRYLATWLQTEIENRLYESGYDAEKDNAMVQVLDLIDADMVGQALDAHENESACWAEELLLVRSSNHG